jgi:hypothetical protein
MNNGFEAGGTQCIHACPESPNTRQNNSIGRGCNTSIGSEHSIGTHTF